MTNISKNFDPKTVEEKWYNHWMKQGYFSSTPDDREPYTIVMPPPNVTGILHMGHCLNNTIQDILIRRARMQGKNACWVPGTDHASIATEAKVVQMLREMGIAKSSLTRENFLEYAWQWKEKYGGIILQQLKKLGCSLDWSRTSFTMDVAYYNSVIEVFIHLYRKGHIYRGKRIINWDVKAKTALSDEEVIRKEIQQQLYYIQYEIDEATTDTELAPTSNQATHTKAFITVATVRPETIMGDAAICVHPSDERYKHLHGKHAIVPLINRRIPIITDEYITMDFGTGALKVTPAHDINDYAIGQKHGLPVIDVLNEDGTLSPEAQIYVGEDRFEVRKKIAIELQQKGYLQKTEAYTSEVGHSERTDTVVEPRLSLQWWVSMKQISQPALDGVISGNIQFHPSKFKNLYSHWMENIKDWCISRQLWWGHRIPVWYDDAGNYYVAQNEEAAYQQAILKNPNFNAQQTKLMQDEDCLDTWFSSWIWPFEVFKGLSNPGNKDAKYYYPTSTLVTAPEIIFFWVARMAMAGYEWMGQQPFKDVYFTGIVRDKQGRKMAKQLGNSPDLLQMIEKEGADAVRFGIMISSPAGNDLMWDEAGNEQGKFFINKMWNALKLVKLWQERQATNSELATTENDTANFAIVWFKNRLQEAQAQVGELIKQFRLSEALKTIYSLVWNDFCSWYLEWVKPDFEASISIEVYKNTVAFFDQILQLIHPFMPFVSEEIYHQLQPRATDLCTKQLLPTQTINPQAIADGLMLQQMITAIRDVRIKNNIKPKEPIQIFIETALPKSITPLLPILQKQVNASNIQLTNEPSVAGISFTQGPNKFVIVSTQPIDTTAQKQALLKDLNYQTQFLESVVQKLNNPKFVANAKSEVIAFERKKISDAQGRIKAIEETLQTLV